MKWRLGDIIDLEYFLHQDADALAAGDREQLRARDRDIFLNSVIPATEADASPSRQFTIKTWLNRRREATHSQNAVPPGEGFDSLHGSLRAIFLVVGLVLGGVAGASFLTYTGDSPVNVFVYLVVFVGSQLVLLLLLLVLSFYRTATKSFPSSPLCMLIGRFIFRILMAARNRISGKLTAEQRQRTGAAFGLITGKARSYGIVVLLPILILTQLFAIGFNLGLLVSTLFKVVTADIAFGWQSTIQLSPSAVHVLAQKIALPWSWAVPTALAHPSLTQIEGSRIILKDGIYHLLTPDLVSWWPFLCFAVLVYGLLPRALLFVGTTGLLRRSLNSLAFRQSAYEQLLSRMTTPLVTTSGELLEEWEVTTVQEFRSPAFEQTPAATDEVQPEPQVQTQLQTQKMLVMIPDELHDFCSSAEIASVVNRNNTHAIDEIIRVNQDYAADQAILAQLRDRYQPAETDILLIQEAWQPPIMESVDFIKQLRQAMGSAPRIEIGLIGKPRADTIFTPANAENLRVWHRTIAALGDPLISSEGLVENES